MNIFLILINFFLVMIILFLIFKKNKSVDNVVNEDMKGIELFEFQQNLKTMIEDFKNFSDEILKKIDEKNDSIKRTIKEADIKISEMKYLIERINILRQNENQIETVVENKSAGKSFQPPKNEIKRNEKTKFVISEKNKENINENDKYSNIKNLLENGLSISEISKITGLSSGEIELIKNLKNKK